jgi:hypothetical protein
VSPAADVAAAARDSDDKYAGPRATLWTLRGVTAVHTAIVIGQPVLAGLYLSGDVDALSIHASDGDLLLLVSFVQVVVALTYFLAGRGRSWPASSSVALFLAEGLQIGMGYSRQLAIHIPLGVGIVVAQMLFTVWVFGRSARRARHRRSKPLPPATSAATSPAASS